MEIQNLLEYGDIVKIRSGDILIVFPKNNGDLETYSNYTRTTGCNGYCSTINNKEYTLLYNKKELKKIQSKCGLRYDIVAILKRDNLKNLSPLNYSYLSYKITAACGSAADGMLKDINALLKRNNIEWDWEEKISAKEMTVSAIEKILGYPIKIVKE